MFTGIIEHLGTVDSLKLHADGGRLTILAPSVAPHLAVANSIAVNGCCLTVVALEHQRFSADLSAETIRKTSMGEWKAGLRVNLEQPMTAGKEFGGHFVLGHVDTIGRVVRLESGGRKLVVRRRGAAIVRQFHRSSRIDRHRWHQLDGRAVERPRGGNCHYPVYLRAHNVRDKKIGDAVNLEGDVLGKYVERYLEARAAAKPAASLNLEHLVAQGF